MAVPIHAIAAAGAGGSDGMRSRGPGGNGRGGISPHRRSSRSKPPVLPKSSRVVLPALAGADSVVVGAVGTTGSGEESGGGEAGFVAAIAACRYS